MTPEEGRLPTWKDRLALSLGVIGCLVPAIVITAFVILTAVITSWKLVEWVWSW